jgi:hypothetical protein
MQKFFLKAEAVCRETPFCCVEEGELSVGQSVGQLFQTDFMMMKIKLSSNNYNYYYLKIPS